MQEIAICTWWEETGRWRTVLRADADGPCSVHGSHHTASQEIEGESPEPRFPSDKYPATCDCGYRFKHGETWGSSEHYFRCLSDKSVKLQRDLPIGALHTTHPIHREGGWTGTGEDQLAIVCKTPGGWWHIDARAANCTLPDDAVHRCWVRHGTVGETLHVDKNGVTCAAGAGSIVIGDWHGFLHNGRLVQ